MAEKKSFLSDLFSNFIGDLFMKIRGTEFFLKKKGAMTFILHPKKGRVFHFILAVVWQVSSFPYFVASLHYAEPGVT